MSEFRPNITPGPYKYSFGKIGPILTNRYNEVIFLKKDDELAYKALPDYIEIAEAARNLVTQMTGMEMSENVYAGWYETYNNIKKLDFNHGPEK
jgi:uncharacterized protein YehS (DUF1456 family)